MVSNGGYRLWVSRSGCEVVISYGLAGQKDRASDLRVQNGAEQARG